MTNRPFFIREIKDTVKVSLQEYLFTGSSKATSCGFWQKRVRLWDLLEGGLAALQEPTLTVLLVLPILPSLLKGKPPDLKTQLDAGYIVDVKGFPHEVKSQHRPRPMSAFNDGERAGHVWKVLGRHVCRTKLPSIKIKSRRKLV